MDGVHEETVFVEHWPTEAVPCPEGAWCDGGYLSGNEGEGNEEGAGEGEGEGEGEAAPARKPRRKKCCYRKYYEYTGRGEVTANSMSCKPVPPANEYTRKPRHFDPLRFDQVGTNERLLFLSKEIPGWNYTNAEKQILEDISCKPVVDAFPVAPTSLGRELQPQSRADYNRGVSAFCSVPDPDRAYFPRENPSVPVGQPLDEVNRQHIKELEEYDLRRKKKGGLPTAPAKKFGDYEDPCIDTPLGRFKRDLPTSGKDKDLQSKPTKQQIKAAARCMKCINNMFPSRNIPKNLDKLFPPSCPPDCLVPKPLPKCCPCPPCVDTRPRFDPKPPSKTDESETRTFREVTYKTGTTEYKPTCPTCKQIMVDTPRYEPYSPSIGGYKYTFPGIPPCFTHPILDPWVWRHDPGKVFQIAGFPKRFDPRFNQERIGELKPEPELGPRCLGCVYDEKQRMPPAKQQDFEMCCLVELTDKQMDRRIARFRETCPRKESFTVDLRELGYDPDSRGVQRMPCTRIQELERKKIAERIAKRKAKDEECIEEEK
ncbi:unnamed protein product [Cyprideis torosa]|uniref:Uncharacterized protein n=1 Tax=Cyprideis torosa TaxID=163714 RepID=A0A7R8ZTV5_9CRUS|nr:unnamed protein product [Cyprideis torosa]CAG0904853.1 unnamed protein product [Cyprideis torosa]